MKATKSELKYAKALKELKGALKTNPSQSIYQFFREHKMNTAICTHLIKEGYIAKVPQSRDHVWIGAEPTVATARKVLKLHRENCYAKYLNHTPKPNQKPMYVDARKKPKSIQQTKLKLRVKAEPKKEQQMVINQARPKFVLTKVFFGLLTIKSKIIY